MSDTIIKDSIPINSELDIVIARQRGRALAELRGFRSIDLALIATAISELTRNIVTYAQMGIIHLEFIEDRGKKGILVQAVDDGPGIKDIELALQDGYSTTNSLGLGLPGVRRLMDDFNIHSELGIGTTITTKKWID
ncbi:MAG: anti-sigma regulatory factor [Gammaproteobacteria bacterium]|nr:anti-sigma regulatory factor [Gammaproteobacteria bacterium]